MRIFIIKSGLFVFIVLTIFAVVESRYNRPVDPRNDYLAALIDKHKRLHELQNKRLVFVGGSNLAFGLNSEEVEKQLGIKTVNLGLHGGLGLDFILNEVVSCIRPGDIVLLSIEYELFDAENQPDQILIEQSQHLLPEARYYYDYTLNDLRILHFKHFSYYFEKHRKAGDTLSIYNRKSFNKWGDINVNIKNDSSNVGIVVGQKITNVIPNGFNPIITEFNELCRLMDVKVYFAFPPYPKSEYEINKTVINNFECKFRREFPSISMIGNSEMFVLNDSLFYDSIYHLNSKGKKIRTDRLVVLLKEIFKIPDNIDNIE